MMSKFEKVGNVGNVGKSVGKSVGNVGIWWMAGIWWGYGGQGSENNVKKYCITGRYLRNSIPKNISVCFVYS